MAVDAILILVARQTTHKQTPISLKLLDKLPQNVLKSMLTKLNMIAIINSMNILL